MRNRRPVLRALSIGCALLVASPSWAAVIEPGSGNLTINQGQGFKPVTSRSGANVGDSLMVGPGGSATLVYDDGCKVSVQPGAVVTVAPLSPCASGSNAADLGLPPPAVVPAETAEGSPWLAVGVGLAAGAGFGVAIWRATEGNGTTSTPVLTPSPPSPASP